MKCSRYSLALLLTLLGCSPSRPEGAYQPQEEFDAAGYGFGSETDAGPEPGDGGPDIFADSSLGNVDPSHPLRGLLGRYLMRVDAYSTASTSKNGTTLTIDSRVSNLLIAQLDLKPDGTLNNREQLCTQTYSNRCVSNCTTWKITVDAALPKFCAQRVIDRSIVVDANGNLQAAQSEIAIGFDEAPGMTALPTSPDDSRVWKLGTNRYAVNTLNEATLGRAPLTTELDCVVSTVQRFSTAFAGKLDLATHGDAALVQKAMRADSTASTAGTVFVMGTPDMYCNESSLKSTSAQPDQVVVVRFQRFDGAQCPSDFEARFPALPERPMASDLM